MLPKDDEGSFIAKNVHLSRNKEQTKVPTKLCVIGAQKLNIIKLMDKVTTDKVVFGLHNSYETSLLSKLIFSGLQIQTLVLLSQELTKVVKLTLQQKIKRSIFQTFWRTDSCSDFLFLELETSNFNYLLIF